MTCGSGGDIISDLGVWGDDLDELIFEYSKAFMVDMESYIWYFHTEEEGNNIGAIFFKTPYQLVKHIPITPNLLLESANEGKWLIVYPEHAIPNRRYDILINYIFILLLIIVAVCKCH